MEFKCTCHNSGTNSFTGACSNCGMSKPSKGTIIANSSSVPKYKTAQEAELEINSLPTKQSVYNQIRLLVNTTKDNQELGEKIRKLFS